MSRRDDEYRLSAPTADESAGDRVQRWEQMLSTTHLPWSVAVPDESSQPFDAYVRRWWIHDLALVDCECDPCSGTRQRRQVAETEGEFFVVLINRAGRETVTQDDVTVTLGPGDAVVWDSTKTARFTVWEKLSKRSLVIPRAALDEVGGKAWAHPGVTLRADSAATQLLTGYLDTLACSLPHLSQSAVAAARNATLELLIGAVRSDSPVVASSGIGSALRDAIDRFIEHNLLDGHLSPSVIASAHGVSVRTVNRAFNATGQTVSETIRIRRLARARGELAEAGKSIGAIASKWGFSDGSHFSRTFKTTYGTTPREFREAYFAGRVANIQKDGPRVIAHKAPLSETGVTPARR
ncbi:helix-turn-helix domain-containing protein [Rhodococcus sp. B10]|uniref:helix-turn-helix domain-containing protein n=1 Tax=Rhodococcus sp. B10 TaxID=2695876 RepID=UPI00142F71E6|nr:helix-turn-helix domain-containing protein [Rhodococcus sp. B10]NIL78336.1 HTH-type transcriptional activator RhaS [Rhodococcus sp. B10]